MTQGPLSGVRVLEFSLIVAGPFAGMNLADLGADVIKVEPPDGEPRRHTGVVPGTSKLFQWLNRGKRSLVLDLKQPAARELIHRILPGIDVVVINYRPGVPKRLGIDYETLSSLKPDLIYAEISGYGPEGPLATEPAADMIAQAYSGAMAAAGKVTPDGSPDMIGGISLGDTAAGVGLAMGICAALFHRERTGEGQLIETSLVHGAMAIAGSNTMREETTDRKLREPIVQKYAEIRDRGGSYAEFIEARGSGGIPLHSRGLNFWAAYMAQDGALAIGANTPPGRAAVRRVLGLEGQGDDDPAYDLERPDRAEQVAAERRQIQDILRQRTVAEWLSEFRAAGAPVAPVMLPEEVAGDEQARHYFVELADPRTGVQKLVKPMVSLSRTPAQIACPAPWLGEHNASVLRDLGLQDDEIAALEDAHVFG